MGAFPLGLRPSRLFAFVTQISRPDGYWVRACDGEIVLGKVYGFGYSWGAA